MAPASQSGIPKRIKDIRRSLGPWPGKLLPRDQLAQRVGVDPSAIKKWETGEVTISTDNALKLAEVAGCDVEWILTGRGTGPAATAAGRAVREDVRVPTSGESTRATPSEPTELLGADEIATSVGKAVGDLIERLAQKRDGMVAAHWLLAVASAAQAQGVNDVRPLIDLARYLMWRAEHAH